MTESQVESALGEGVLSTQPGGTTSNIEHDAFDSKGYWDPPGGRELYFHSGFSEVLDGCEVAPNEQVDSRTLRHLSEVASVLRRRLSEDRRTDMTDEHVRAALRRALADSVQGSEE